MLSKRQVWTVLSLVGFASLSGCGPKPTIDDIKTEMTKAKPRAAELDQLEKMVGTWETQGEMTFTGIEGKITFSGTSTSSWDLDKNVLVERINGEMAGSTMTGISMMWWDDREKEFRTFWIDSKGMSMEGEGEYNAKTGTWEMESEGVDPHSGQSTSGVGTMKLIDDNTMEWSHTEKNAWGMVMMQMKGTSKRRA